MKSTSLSVIALLFAASYKAKHVADCKSDTLTEAKPWETREPITSITAGAEPTSLDDESLDSEDVEEEVTPSTRTTDITENAKDLIWKR